MKEYTVVNKKGLEPFIEEVNKYIKEGWTPLGGVCSMHVEAPISGKIAHLYEHYQAMVRNLPQ